MKKYAYNEISFLQYVFIIFNLEIGVGVIPLPASIVKLAGTDSWLAVILGWLVVTAGSVAIIQVMKKFPEGTLPELLSHHFGIWAGRAGAFLLALYFGFFFYTVFVRLVLYLKVWLLPHTEDALLVIFLIIPVWLIARHGLRVQGRFAELVFYFSCILPFVYVLSLKDNTHWLHLFPILKEGWTPVLQATPEMIFTYLGYEIPFLIYPFLQKKHLATLGVITANTLAMLVYLLVTLACLLFYSPDEIKSYNDLNLNLLKMIQFPVFERFEVIFFAFYMPMMLLTCVPVVYCSVFCTSWLLGKKDHSRHLFIALFLVTISYFFFTPTFRQSDDFLALLGRMGLWITIIFPFVLWMLLSTKNHFNRKQHL